MQEIPEHLKTFHDLGVSLSTACSEVSKQFGGGTTKSRYGEFCLVVESIGHMDVYITIATAGLLGSDHPNGFREIYRMTDQQTDRIINDAVRKLMKGVESPDGSSLACARAVAYILQIRAELMDERLKEDIRPRIAAAHEKEADPWIKQVLLGILKGIYGCAYADLED